MNFTLILLGKIISLVIKLLNLGNGSTWPGHIALKINQNFIKDNLKNSNIKTIIIAGTNGKTTTTKLLQSILEQNNKKVILNISGANLLNGIASTIILKSNILGIVKSDYAIFEIDENIFAQICRYISPDIVIILNLFRDQLDRYGEIDSISKKWRETIKYLDKTTLVLNADDPQIASLGLNYKYDKFYFGLEDNNLKTSVKEHAADSILCPNCNSNLKFKSYYFSHLGDWSCNRCYCKRPKPDLSKLDFYPLPGTYAIYNSLAAVLTANVLKINKETINKGLKTFKPAFGRQEELRYKNKNIQIFLSKNPISLNESLATIKNLGGSNILISLNDRIPDGLDVSWIWDVDFERILNADINIGVTGDRLYDMCLRLKYADFFIHYDEDSKNILDKMCENLESDEKLYIVANYSAMLELRKIITGKKIL